MKNQKQIAIYKYCCIEDLKDIMSIYKKEKEKGQIESIYIVVKYYNNELEKFKDINEAIDYIKEDYKNNSKEFGLKLNGYSIDIEVYTKPINNEGIHYNYSYDMDLLGLGGVINE